jgi:isopentenyl-diphosphate delta-isomerase
LEILDTKSENTIITLVNEADEITGYEEKMKVHREGLLHRAFSVLIFDEAGQMLIHQRAFSKYHSPGLWTNTCCGHPNRGEENRAAAVRRLGEEMGFQTELKHQFTFHYRAEFDNGLIENEIDYVYFGEFVGDFQANPEEVADYKWLSLESIKNDIAESPEKYTVWFKEIMKRT